MRRSPRTRWRPTRERLAREPASPAIGSKRIISRTPFTRSACTSPIGPTRGFRCAKPATAPVRSTRPIRSRQGLIIAYTKNRGTPVEVQTRTCLSCHAGGPRDHWLGSVHQRNGLSCSDCHNPMSKFSVEGSMAKISISDTCAQCHKDIRLQFNRRSHMPLPEGQMSCDDCHNPHGTLTESLAEDQHGQRNLLSMPCGEARTVPLRASAGARELSQLSSPARLESVDAAGRTGAVFVPAMPHDERPFRRAAKPARAQERLESGTAVDGPRLPDLSCQHPRVQCAIRRAFPRMKTRHVR